MAYSNLIFYPRWEQPGLQSNIAYDVEGYYWYLPSIFIYKNLKTQHFEEGQLSKIQSSGKSEFENGFEYNHSGNYVLKYSSGMAFMYAPAFFSGHIVAGILGYEQNGFSPPYKLALQIWGLLFSFLGLFYLRKLLKLFYSDGIVAISLLLLVFGTNYLNYAGIDIGMSHAWLFVLYVFILLNTHYFYQSQKGKYAIRVGLLIGLATLIRPTEIIATIIPLLWGVENWGDIKKRFQFLKTKKTIVMTAIISAFAIISIQLFYWHYVSGHWLVYSYQDQGFNFIRPHAFVYSFSYRAGWLTYSPMMLLSIFGYFLYSKKGKNKFAILLFFMLNYYIVSAWNIWDYGGYSGRAMIQSYPILLFPFATFLVFLKEQKMWKIIFIPIIAFFLYINIWFTYQAHCNGGLIDAFTTTKEYFWKMYGRWTLPIKYQKLKDTDELFEGEMANSVLIFQKNDTTNNCISETEQNYKINVENIALKQEWIRVSADFDCIEKEWNLWEIPQFIVALGSNGKEKKVRMIRIHRFVERGEKANIYLDIKTPNEEVNQLTLTFWNAGSKSKTCISNIKVWSFDE